jgi:hypothetical protein
MTLNITKLCTESHHVECIYFEFHISFIVMLNDVMLSTIMLHIGVLLLFTFSRICFLLLQLQYPILVTI